MKDWIIPIATLLGVIVGGGIGFLNSRFQVNRQEARERKKLALEKLEKLHEAISTFNLAYDVMTLGIVTSGITGSPMDMDRIVKLPTQEVEMLSGFYAPELGQSIKELMQIHRSLGEFAGQCISAKGKSEIEIKQLFGLLINEKGKLEKLCDAIKKEISDLAQKYIS
jgi:hypothetical protein